MTSNQTKGAVLALLWEYKKAIAELQDVIRSITDTELTTIVDLATTNEDCRSVQTVLTHVVSSGYSYCVYIENARNINSERPDKIQLASTPEYISALDDVFRYTRNTFTTIYDHELEELDSTKNIKTNWGKLYDIEQLIEHAIVHVLRHRRQIEKFKTQFSK